MSPMYTPLCLHINFTPLSNYVPLPIKPFIAPKPREFHSSGCYWLSDPSDKTHAATHVFLFQLLSLLLEQVKSLNRIIFAC